MESMPKVDAGTKSRSRDSAVINKNQGGSGMAVALEPRQLDITLESIDSCLSTFLENAFETETEFPNAVKPVERDYIVNRVSELNGVTCDIGRRREKEFITLRKEYAHRRVVQFLFCRTSYESLASLMPFKTNKDNGGDPQRARLQCRWGKRVFYYDEPYATEDDIETVNNVGCGNRLHINFPPRVPPKRPSDDFAEHRQGLSIWKYQDQILSSLVNHRVTVIIGQAGSGKSTQVPQFILDVAASSGTPTKILSCQPHRLSAIAAAGCVARERGERIGITIGYQARLESCYSPPSSALIFSTNELFLRSLIPPTFPVLNNITYIIMDDIHLRDATSDFGLTCLLSLMPGYQFRLILLCGELDADGLLVYLRKSGAADFGIIRVENYTSFTPNIYHLADIKRMMGMKPEQVVTTTTTTLLIEAGAGDKFRSPFDTVTRCKCCNLPRSGHLANVLIHRYIFLGDTHSAEEFIDLVLRHEISINGTHQATGITLMAAAGFKGNLHLMWRLISLGANFCQPPKHGWSMLATMKEFRQPLSAQLLNNASKSIPPDILNKNDVGAVNLKFIREVIQFIHSSSPLKETILVYLSSYDEIVTLKEMLFHKTQFQFDPQSFVVSLLHVNIPCGDERVIFEEPPSSVRKIVLTTDVADTISVKDAVHVIDTGYTEEKTYNAKNCATGNRKVLICKSAALERVHKNTFRIYDKETFAKMPSFRTPEITQSPLQELCLYSTSLLKGNSFALKFFGQFLSPPPEISLTRSYQELIEIGALDSRRKITPLGCYLLDIPVDPRLGKALIYATILRCLDPVLTIVAILAHRDPFKTPQDIKEQVEIRARKELLSRNTYSDHMAMLQAFLEWENDSSGNPDNSASNLNFVSPGIFDMVCAIRTDLLAQLRAFGFVRCKGVGNIRDLNHNSYNWSVVKAALIAALYPNVMKVNGYSWTLSNSEFNNARFHPSSCIARDPMGPAILPSSWVIYDEVNQSNGLDFCKGCTLISSFALLVFGGSPSKGLVLESLSTGYSKQGQPDEMTKVTMSDSVVFVGRRSDMELVSKIRNTFQMLVDKHLRRPGNLLTQNEERDLQTISLILTTEDRATNLSQIDGIGQWPRFAGGSLLSVPRQGFTKSATDSNAQRDED